MHAVPRRTSTVVGLVAAAGLVLSGLAAMPAAAATVTSVSINDPAAAGQVVAGNVTLTGAVTQGSDVTTTVLYVVDATNSTHDSAADCAADDLNGDGVDVLECEIGAVSQLNSNLAAAFPLGGLVAGVEAFATPTPSAPTSPTQVAQLADLNASGQLFASAGDTGGGAQPRIITAVRSIRQGEILESTHKTLSGGGFGLDPAIDTALAALRTAPAGPKWITLLSDDRAPVSQDRIDAVSDFAGGVHLNSFTVGTATDCAKYGALTRLAKAGGESCRAASPANLAGLLSDAHPDFFTGVTVSIGSTSVEAEVNAVGGWQAKFTLGQGTYTATSTARLRSGGTVTKTRSFSVLDATGSGGPKAGTVSAGPGALLATAVQVSRPAPSRAALPSRVTGQVGLLTKNSLTVTKQLNGATVLLQGRKSVGSTWVTLGRGTVKAGAYSLRWKPLRSIHLLRVSLQERGDLAASSLAVPPANIWGCVVKRHSASWSMTCHTTATHGSKVRVYKGSHVVDRAKAASGLVKVHAAGRLGAHVLVVKLSRKHHAPKARLAL